MPSIYQLNGQARLSISMKIAEFVLAMSEKRQWQNGKNAVQPIMMRPLRTKFAYQMGWGKNGNWKQQTDTQTRSSQFKPYTYSENLRLSMRIELARHSRLQRTHLGGQYSSFSEQSAQMEWHRKVILLHTTFSSLQRTRRRQSAVNLAMVTALFETHTQSKQKKRIYYFHAIRCIINSIDTLYIHYKKIKNKKAHNYHYYYLLTPENSAHAPYSIRCAVQRQQFCFIFFVYFRNSVTLNSTSDYIIITSKAMATNDK